MISSPLKIIWERWKIIALHIGVFQSRVILSLFYFILLLPIGFVFSGFKDALGIKTKHTSTWRNKEKQSLTLDQLKEQF